MSGGRTGGRSPEKRVQRAGTPRRKPRGRAAERVKTDTSLRTERDNTDSALSVDRASEARSADGLVNRAREVADAVLSADRLRADREPQRAADEDAIVGARAVADKLVIGERASADVALRGDRKTRADALTELLVHERAATDAYLLTERVRSDNEVTNRDDFLGMVAHDVRNLLNLVVLSLELFQPGEGAPPPDIPAVTNRIRRYVARMNGLVGDLVDVTAIDAGKLAIEPSDGDVVVLVAEATETFRSAAREKGLTLLATVPDTPIRAFFDADRVLQVFANLIANAIKFTPREGVIEVRVEQVQGMVRFCVADSGVGIPVPLLKAIFDRFWQGGKNDRRGMGLGLYISKCIVEAHRGRIWAKSVPGRGSELYFTLPLAAGSRRRGSGDGAAAARSRPERADEGGRRRAR
jgi:signal transduction histidine kinase